MNVASSLQFQEYIRKQKETIAKVSNWEPSKTKTFPNSWKVEEMQLDKAIEYHLLDPKGEIKYKWVNLDPQVPQVELITHSNGNEYLIYHINLYGISVFNLNTLTNYDYYPERSFPFDKEDFKESFIWTNTFYHSDSNLIVFFGCFWACPYTGMIADFTDPMNTTDYKWYDLQNLVDASRDEFWIDDVIGWDGDRLKIRIENQNDSSMKEIAYTVEDIKKFIKEQEKE